MTKEEFVNAFAGTPFSDIIKKVTEKDFYFGHWLGLGLGLGLPLFQLHWGCSTNSALGDDGESVS
jgi:hypothetical protein